MDFFQAKRKKKLNFDGNSFVEPEFKIPCKDSTNHHNNTECEARSRITSASCFGDDEESSRDSEMSSGSAGNALVRDTVNVFLRLKPGKSIPDVYAIDKDNVTLKGSTTAVDRQFTFTSVLEQNTDQKTVYDTCVRSVLSNPFADAGAVFASYGISNSGKTYTILGEKSAGIVPRALTQLFSQYTNHIAPFPCVKVVNEQIQILDDRQVEAEIGATMDFLHDSRMQTKVKSQSWIPGILAEHQFEPKINATAHQQIFIWVSFVEIYNEKMIDLFKSQKPVTGASSTIPRALKIISNNRNSYVHGLTWLHVDGLEKALELLQAGLRRVNYAETGLNKHSSRSHTIFTINIIAECDSNYEFSSYKFCDLAGAERISRTGNVGERVKEAGGINTSLMVLGKCLEAVQHNQKSGIGKKEIVPVRESKLTFLLQSSLMGRENFVMIVNLLPTIECYEENLNVLHFGSIAKKIITRKTEVKKYSRMSSRYTYFMQNVVNSPKMNSSLAFDDSVIPEGDESSSILSTSFMTADELRHELRLKDVEIAALRSAVEECERRNVNLRKEIMTEFQGCAELKRESDRKYFEEGQERQQIYFGKKMESMRMGFEKKLDKVYEINDFLTHENRKLKKKLGIKDDEDIIDLDDSDDGSTDDESEEREKPIQYGNDEIENIGA